MQPDASPATPICKEPNNADALPTFFEKGAKARAVALGLVNPRQDSATKKCIVASSPYHWFQEPIKKTSPVTSNVDSAILKICSLEYFLLIRIFNWLPPIKPMDRNAKIPPYTCGLT